jgi:hypothetical protein
MRRLSPLPLALSALLSSHATAAGTSTATTILEPDIICNVSSCGALYVQALTLGVSVTNPTGQQLLWTSADIEGGGLVHLRQGGHDSQYGGASTNVPIQALHLSFGSGGIHLLNTATVLPAPDLSFTQADATSSYLHVASASGDVDWKGGIATPTGVAGESVLGTIQCAINVSGGGNAINVIDVNVDGSIRIGWPSFIWGYLETACFVWDSSGWQILSRGPSYYFNGGDEGGGRVLTTTTASPTPLLRYTKGGGVTGGIAIVGDIAANLSGGGATGYWMGVKCAWDSANVVSIPLVVTTSGGNNSGAPPAGWGLSCTDDATFHNINAIGVAATTIKWRANHFHATAPPF